MKKSHLLICFLICLIEFSYAQDGQTDSFYTPDGKRKVTIAALYPGKTAGLNLDIANNMKIPKKAVKDEIHGQLIIQITIDTFGNVTNPKIIKSLREDVDQAAVEMTAHLKPFIPARMGGKTVPFVIKIPIKI